MRFRVVGAVAAGVLAVSALAFAQSRPFEQRAREIFKQLVEINTAQANSTTVAADAMAARLKAAGFPPDDVRVLGPVPTRGNLVARFRGTGARRPLLLLAHLDVVDAKREDWSMDPFVFTERDGFFYGRGTTDDKGMASQFVANLIRLKEEGFRPDRDLIIALTADEEGGDFNGADWLVKQHRPLIDAAYALNEGGSGLSKNGKYLVLELQAAEKIYQDFRLEVRNAGGHSSLPVKDNAISHLSGALVRLGAFAFPIRLDDLTRAYFERSASVQPDARVAADMRAVGRTGDLRAADRLAAANPLFNALMHTTCVATRLEGGHANNALPQMAAAIVNCRLLPGDSPTAIRQQLTKVIADSAVEVKAIDEANVSLPGTLVPEVTTAIERIAKDMFPGVVVVPVMSTGATDGLFLRNAGIPTFGVDGMFGDMDDVRAHGRDERVGVTQYFEGLEFQYRLIKSLSSGR